MRAIGGRILAGAVSLVLLAFASQDCGSKSPPVLATGCQLDSDCNANLICVYGRCHVACVESRDCSAGAMCIPPGVCELPAEEKCSETLPCVVGLTCAGDQCLAACYPGVPAGQPGGCLQGQTCTAVQGAATAVCEDPGDGGVPESGPGDGGTDGAGNDGGTEGGGTDGAPFDAGDAGACSAPDAGPTTFSCPGSLAVGRIAPAAGPLPGGTVLVAGGWNATGNALLSAEIFDPATGQSTPTGPMAHDLWGGWGSVMPSAGGGKLLAAGGIDSTGALVATAEIYDPVSGDFTPAGTMPTPVISLFPITLGDGSTLYIGGWNSVVVAPPTPGWQYNGSGTGVVQRYTPGGSFATTGPLAENRLNGCDVLLPSGKVLTIGGATGPSSFETNIEQYDPTGGAWTTVGTLSTPSCAFAFALPGTTKVLMTGTGGSPDAQLLDTGTFAVSPTTGAPAGWQAIYTQLPNGDVLGVSGTIGGVDARSAYVFHASTGAWTQVADVPSVHGTAFVLVPLTTGSIAIVGGSDASSAATTNVEIYHP
jgi:hypothetical protein